MESPRLNWWGNNNGRKRARYIGATVFTVPAALSLAKLVKMHKRMGGGGFPKALADIGKEALPGVLGKPFRFLGRRSPKGLLALGLGGVGLAALGGAVLGRGVQHSYRRSRLRYPLSSHARGVGAGIVKGTLASPLITFRDLRRRLRGKVYGIEGV